MSRPTNFLALTWAREGVLTKSAGTLLDELMDQFDLSRRQANRYVNRARREISEQTAKTMPHRLGMAFAKLEKAVEVAAARGNDSAVVAGLKVEIEALRGPKSTTVNVGVAVGQQAAAPQELARLTDVELAVFAALAAKAEGADLDGERLAVLAHVALLPGAHGNGPRLLEVSCAPTGPDDAQDAADAQPAAPAAKPAMTFEKWHQERAKSRGEDLPTAHEPAADPGDVAEPEHFTTADE